MISTHAAAEQLTAAQIESLVALLDVEGPSGFEQPVADLVVRMAQDAGADDVRIDAIGNVHVVFGAGRPGRRMLTAHIDEIGFLVTGVTEHGLLRFDRIGGWDRCVPVGQRVRVMTQHGVRCGIVGRTPIHLLTTEQSDQIPHLHELWVDIGARDRGDAESQVRIGDPIVLDAAPVVFDSRRVMSRAMDDRIGVYIALEAARRAVDSPTERHVMAAVCEETTGHGALAGAYSCNPSECIAIDVTPSTDTPGEHEEVVEIGLGPVIAFGSVVGTRIGNELLELARRTNMPVQLQGAGTITSTDADLIARAGAGIPVGLVGVPTRHLHTPGEICLLDDVEWCIELLVAWLDRDV